MLEKDLLSSKDCVCVQVTVGERFDTQERRTERGTEPYEEAVACGEAFCRVRASTNEKKRKTSSDVVLSTSAHTGRKIRKRKETPAPPKPSTSVALVDGYSAMYRDGEIQIHA